MPLATVPSSEVPALGALMAGGWSSIAMIVMGLGLVAMVLLHFRNARRSRTTRQPSGAPVPGPTADAHLAGEIAGLSRRLADELDSRADRLEKLMADADVRLARLERLTGTVVHAAPESAHGLAEVKHYGTSGPGDRTVRSAAAVIAEIDPIALEVYQLADGGVLPVQIAQRLGQHTGKIELILALRRG